MNLEREVKLTVGPLFHLPDLSEVVDGFSAEGEGVQRFVTSYYDTQDLRLARWGCSLRYRTGDGWTVKLPAATVSDTLAREEHHFEAGPGRPPAPALDLLRGYLRQEPVSLAVRLQTVRRITRLLDAEAKPAAEVVDDEVSVLDGRRVVARFRELEAELTQDADEAVIDPVIKRLVAEGAQRAEPALPKYVRALMPLAAEPPEVEQPGKRPTSVESMIRTALSASVIRLIRHDAAVRLGSDTEGVHQARVATRRLRSDLRTFRSLLEPAWDAQLRDELRWLGDELGAVRDLDVLGERLRAHASMLPDEDAVTMRKLLDRLRAQRDEARAAMLSALREDRYDVLLDRLVAAATAPAVLDDVASTPALDVIDELISGPWGHLLHACESLGPGSADADLHAARIRAKRVRYAAEAVAPVVGKRARRFAERAAALQDELGEHQDSVVAAAWLRDQAAGTSARVAFTAGELGAIEARLQRRARRRWPDAWAALDRKKLRFW